VAGNVAPDTSSNPVRVRSEVRFLPGPLVTRFFFWSFQKRDVEYFHTVLGSQEARGSERILLIPCEVRGRRVALAVFVFLGTRDFATRGGDGQYE
jgi:hypothetical protein